MKYKILLLIILSFVSVFIFAINTLAVGVQPLALDYLLKPGATTDFKISLSGGETPEDLKLYVCKAEQKLNGDISFEAADPAEFPLAKWISIPASVKVASGNKEEVVGTIKVPLDASGCYVFGIMIEPREENVKGINIMVRYAVRLMIRIDRPGYRPEAAVSSFNMIKGDKGQPVIIAQIKNKSNIDYMTSANATIRDSNQRLVERLPLLTGSNEPEFLMLPNSELRYTGIPTEALTPGKYEIRLFFNYASGKQILFAKNIEVKAGDYDYPPSKLKNVKISPLQIDFEGRAKTTSIKPVKFENKYNKPVIICLEPEDIEPKYPFSIFTNTDLTIQGETTFTLDPGRIATTLITVKFKDQPAQENYGLLKVKVYSNEDKPKLLEESTINLTAVIPGKLNYAADVLSLSSDQAGDRYIFSAVILNKGNARISPIGRVVLTDKSGKVVETINLSNEVTENDFIIPGKQTMLSGLSSNLKPGTYQAQVYVMNEKTSLGVENFDLIVK